MQAIEKKQDAVSNIIQNKLYFRYRVKLAQQKKKDNEKVIEFFKEEYEKLQEPIRLAEELERERKLLVGPEYVSDTYICEIHIVNSNGI